MDQVTLELLDIFNAGGTTGEPILSRGLTYTTLSMGRLMGLWMPSSWQITFWRSPGDPWIAAYTLLYPDWHRRQLILSVRRFLQEKGIPVAMTKNLDRNAKQSRLIWAEGVTFRNGMAIRIANKEMKIAYCGFTECMKDINKTDPFASLLPLQKAHEILLGSSWFSLALIPNVSNLLLVGTKPGFSLFKSAFAACDYIHTNAHFLLASLS